MKIASRLKRREINYGQYLSYIKQARKQLKNIST